LVKARAGYKCERCGAEPEDQRGFHAHHVYGRSNYRLRFEPRNGVALCWPCHNWAETTPLEFADWFYHHRTEDPVFLVTENAKGLIRRNLHDYLELEAELSLALERLRLASEVVADQTKGIT
jgi:hypothetical protein